MSTAQDQAAKVRRVWEKGAPGYDKQIAFFEKIWFGGGRQWLGARAQGRVLAVAIGTGLNLPFYPAEATIKGVDLSPAILAIARQRATAARDALLLPRSAPFSQTGQANRVVPNRPIRPAAADLRVAGWWTRWPGRRFVATCG